VFGRSDWVLIINLGYLNIVFKKLIHTSFLFSSNIVQWHFCKYLEKFETYRFDNKYTAEFSLSPAFFFLLSLLHTNILYSFLSFFSSFFPPSFSWTLSCSLLLFVFSSFSPLSQSRFFFFFFLSCSLSFNLSLQFLDLAVLGCFMGFVNWNFVNYFEFLLQICVLVHFENSFTSVFCF